MLVLICGFVIITTSKGNTETTKGNDMSKFSNKVVKQLNKGLAKGINAKVVGSEAQGNGHVKVLVEVKGHGIIEVIGAPATPRDFNFVANHLRKSVKRAVAANESVVAYS
jgi:hypothetical protein